MKKGFTMIELIFVIVILGILASVAIPRLAGTRADAEVATTISNLRTLVGEASSYYVAHGKFDNVKWRDLTNVPLKATNNTAIGDTLATADAYLKVGDTADCITVRAVAKNPTTKAPAHLVFAKKQVTPTAGGQATTMTEGVCGQVLAADAVKAIIDNTIKFNNGTDQINNAMPVCSTTSVY